MTACLGKSCSFGLMCVSLVHVYQFVCVLFPFGVEGWIGYIIVLFPDHCFSIYLE